MRATSGVDAIKSIDQSQCTIGQYPYGFGQIAVQTKRETRRFGALAAALAPVVTVAACGNAAQV